MTKIPDCSENYKEFPIITTVSGYWIAEFFEKKNNGFGRTIVCFFQCYSAAGCWSVSSKNQIKSNGIAEKVDLIFDEVTFADIDGQIVFLKLSEVLDGDADFRLRRWPEYRQYMREQNLNHEKRCLCTFERFATITRYPYRVQGVMMAVFLTLAGCMGAW